MIAGRERKCCGRYVERVLCDGRFVEKVLFDGRYVKRVLCDGRGCGVIRSM